jgi:hypothetical protein
MYALALPAREPDCPVLHRWAAFSECLDMYEPHICTTHMLQCVHCWFHLQMAEESQQTEFAMQPPLQ